MFSRGLFLGIGTSEGTNNGSDVNMIDGNIVFSPSDNIYIDEQARVFYSTEKPNSYLYLNDNGNVTARKVN